MTNLFGAKILMNPWVILPLLILATVILAYLIAYPAQRWSSLQGQLF